MPTSSEFSYVSPSALHRNKQRHYYALHGEWSIKKERLCNTMDERRFYVPYGYNPRCSSQGMRRGALIANQ